MLVLYGMYNSNQFGSVEDKSTEPMYIYVYICSIYTYCIWLNIYSDRRLYLKSYNLVNVTRLMLSTLSKNTNYGLILAVNL